MSRVSLTGNIGTPMLTPHGAMDTLLPIAKDSDRYDRMVDTAGRGALHGQHRIEDGNHVDQLADTPSDATRANPAVR